jgi:hypothetical protein
MAEQRSCDICDNKAEYSTTRDSSQSWSRVIRRCPRCGEFEYNRDEGLPKVRSPDDMVRLSGWVREQNATGVAPVRITPETWHRVARMRLPGLRERASRALAYLARDPFNASFPRATAVQDPELQGRSYSKGERDVSQLIEILMDQGFLRVSGAAAVLTVKGLLEAEAQQAPGSNSPNGFVAMSFDPSLRDVWTNGFDPAIRAAGFHPVRLDDKDYVGGITDEIMTEIRRSRFVVVDYTGHRHNVYFEAGFALGLGLTVIPTCRADENDKLQFDIRHLNTLVWNAPADLADKLEKRITAVIGAGPNADPS